MDDFTIVTITNTNSSPVRLKILSEVQGFTDQSIDTVTVEGNDVLEVRQNPRIISDKIENLNVNQPAQFHIRVTALQQGVEKILLEETGETLVFARRDFPWSIPGMSEAEAFELLAAMVTPNDPKVEELLRHAADYTESGMMWGGYSGSDNDSDGAVWERLEAIWLAEEKVYNLTYVSTLVTYAPGDIQRIRLPRETLEQRAGNCIDLSLLFASAAEAIRLEAAIIGIPGHAFVAIRTDQTNDRYYFIETTLIGQTSFERAVEIGSEEWNEAAEHVANGESSYNWVTIPSAREKGIFPLPWP
ncbi:MAG: transglutaminase-like domain-containing protein [Anaerolineales bacterium]|nr:transglutaminase-like domain-containing protein [Anaerolineales bacterium]